MSWDPFQREVLAELGHALYVVRDPPARASEASTWSSGTAVESAADAAWLTQLARAAGMAPARLLQQAPDLALQAAGLDAAAKRALWPRLRALRREAR